MGVGAHECKREQLTRSICRGEGGSCRSFHPLKRSMNTCIILSHAHLSHLIHYLPSSQAIIPTVDTMMTVTHKADFPHTRLQAHRTGLGLDLPYFHQPASAAHFLPSLSSSSPACLFACLPAQLPACLLACLFACLPTCLPACLPAFQPTCLPVCLPTCLPACLPAYQPACLPACLPVCLPTSLPTRLSASMLAFQSA